MRPPGFLDEEVSPYQFQHSLRITGLVALIVCGACSWSVAWRRGTADRIFSRLHSIREITIHDILSDREVD